MNGFLQKRLNLKPSSLAFKSFKSFKFSPFKPMQTMQNWQRWLQRQLPPWLRLSRQIDRWNFRLGQAMGWLVVAMLAIGSWNVIGRYLGRAIGQNLTSNTSIELQWYLFSGVFLLGAAYTMQRNGHVRVDVFYKNWSPRTQAIANLVGTVLFLMPFSALVLMASWQWTANAWMVQELSPDPGGLPRYPIKGLILISFVVLMIQGVSEIIKNLAIIAGLGTDPSSQPIAHSIAPHQPSQPSASQASENPSENSSEGDR